MCGIFMCLFDKTRGDELVAQPIIKGQNFLQFNGELYEMENDAEFDQTSRNDGLYLMDRLVECEDEQSVLSLLSSLRGEFSFVYWSNHLRTIYFGRDYFGRRSLCWNIDSKLFLGDTDFNDLTALRELEGLSECSRTELIETKVNLNDLEDNFCISSIAYYDDRRDWTEVPAIGIYKLSLDQNDTEDYNQIKLIRWKTSFLRAPINNKFNFELLEQITDDVITQYELEFLRLLRKSVDVRVLKQNFKCRTCSDHCDHSCLAVLFSGGLDSTVLALLANEFMPNHSSIDLINLAFTRNAPDRQTGWSSYLELKKLAPNRKWNFVAVDITTDQLVECRERLIKKIIYPLNTVLDDSIGCAMYFASSGKGKLIQDDLYTGDAKEFDDLNSGLNRKEFQDQQRSVSDLISRYPSEAYETTSKVLLLGQGADEQLAGYARHRSTFKLGGWSALQKELNLDINRISYRNLSRDDRMISSNGRESRYPFLDDNVVNFLNSLPTNVKCDLNQAKGEGDKRLLRLIGRRLGLAECCRYEKRAIQFGSKIAKLENKKDKATDVSERLI